MINEIPTEKYCWVTFGVYIPFINVSFHFSPQDDYIEQEEFIEENFNDEDFQTTC